MLGSHIAFTVEGVCERLLYLEATLRLGLM